MTDRNDLKNKIWNDICGILREEGMHIGTYVEQFTVLLFLKMMDDRPKFGDEDIEIPDEYGWESLLEKDGEELLYHYNNEVVPNLSDQPGIIGEIFARVNSQFRTPRNLKEAVREIDNIDWHSIDADVKGTAYESLLERYAEKAEGAGQYFTPRPAIEATVEAVDPDHDDDIHDPAAGTGGFLIHAFDHILDKTDQGAELSRDERRALTTESLTGLELVPETRRLGLMNLALHDLQPQNFEVGNSLAPGEHANRAYDVVLTNPPYGGNQPEAPAREDFMVETRSPEQNFVQHAMSVLRDGGECGMVVPDGVLFQSGAAKRIRKNLFEDFDLHTVLVLPIGAFQPYTNVATNIIFFEKGGTTDEVWFYDLRTDVEKIKKSNPLTDEHFEDFLENYDSREDSEKYFRVSMDEIEENDYTLNYKKYKEFDNGEEVAPPEELLTELRSLQDTVRDNTEAIMDELEGD
jgi:type I restriction enzyme M protein